MDEKIRELQPALTTGLVAGLLGGIVFGAGLTKVGMITVIASLLGSQSAVVAWLLNIVISAIVGAVFGLLFYQHVQRVGAGLAWGLTYGLLWWFLGALTGMSVLRGSDLEWSVSAVRPMFPSLIGHLLFGLVLGGSFAVIWVARGLSEGEQERSVRRGLTRFALGGIAGLIALVIYRIALGSGSIGPLRHAFGLPTAVVVVLLGGIFAVLFEDELTGHGSGLSWGLVYGFATWTLVPLTLLPLIRGSALRWSLAGAEETLSSLMALLMFNALMAVVFFTLVRLRRALFSDEVTRARADEGIGARSVRAIAWGVVASLAGGVAFTVVMVWMEFLPAVAGLIGARSAIVGFIVHMVISAIIGGTYGLLFRKEASTLGAGITWGLVYGFYWWILGVLSLMPRLLGSEVAWTVGAARGGFPSLVGHLAYGAVTALIFQALANRYELGERGAGEPSIRPSIMVEAAPVWASILMLGLTLPLLLTP